MAYPTTSFDFRDPLIGEIEAGSHFYYPTAALAPQWQPTIQPHYEETNFDPFSTQTWATESVPFPHGGLPSNYQPQLQPSLNTIQSVTSSNGFLLKTDTEPSLPSAFQSREIIPQLSQRSAPPPPPAGAPTKLFSCGRCGKQYCRKSTLKAHVKHHMGERPFICIICGKTFSQAANLTAHRRVHTGEKPFSCSICLRPFSQSSSLVTHKRTHTGERPYPCNHCDKAFTDSSTLTKHLRTHSGQKPYECPLCAMRFSQSGNLHRHLKTHRISDVDVKQHQQQQQH